MFGAIRINAQLSNVFAQAIHVGVGGELCAPLQVLVFEHEAIEFAIGRCVENDNSIMHAGDGHAKRIVCPHHETTNTRQAGNVEAGVESHNTHTAMGTYPCN